MTAAGGFGADPDQVRGIAAEITGAVDGVKADETADLAANGPAFGHDGVARALAEFCEATKLATDVLMQSSHATSTGLHEVANTYVSREDDARMRMDRLAPGVAPPGGPHG